MNLFFLTTWRALKGVKCKYIGQREDKWSHTSVLSSKIKQGTGWYFIKTKHWALTTKQRLAERGLDRDEGWELETRSAEVKSSVFG